MSFLNIKDPDERGATIEYYLALKERIKERNLEERGVLMDRRRELEETFEPVLASNEKMARDIIKDLEPINEGIKELNRNFEINEVNRSKPPPRIGGKRKIGKASMVRSPRDSIENTSIRMAGGYDVWYTL